MQFLILAILLLLLKGEDKRESGLSIIDIYNRRQKGLKLIGLGLMLNGLILMFSGAAVPLEGTILAHLGYNETYLSMEKEQAFSSYLIHEQTKSLFLSDVIHLPTSYPHPQPGGLGLGLVGFGLLIQLALFETSRQVRAPTVEGGCVL